MAKPQKVLKLNFSVSFKDTTIILNRDRQDLLVFIKECQLHGKRGS